MTSRKVIYCEPPMILCSCGHSNVYLQPHSLIGAHIKSPRYVFALVFHGRSSFCYFQMGYDHYIKSEHDALHYLDVEFGTVEQWEVMELHARAFREGGIPYALWERINKRWRRVEISIPSQAAQPLAMESLPQIPPQNPGGAWVLGEIKKKMEGLWVETYFEKLHTTKGVGTNAAKLKAEYKKLSEEQKRDFRKLPVERQMALLCVPVRRQNAYKKEGNPEAYVYAEVTSKKRANKIMGRWDTQDEKLRHTLRSEGQTIHYPKNW